MTRALAISLAALAACSGSAGRPPPEEPAAPPPARPSGPPGQVASGFRLTFEPAKGEASKAVKSLLERAGTLKVAVEGLNQDFEVPRGIAVDVLECDEPNAFYDPEQRRLRLCYGMVSLVSEAFGDIESDREHTVATLGTTLFIFFHELGHALIHELDLPITGREEDAVDQLATLLLINGGPDGVQAARDGAAFFARLAERRGGAGSFWGEHSLEEQRFFNVLCWVYGSDPASHADLVKQGALPAARAERCPEEWARLQSAWSALLAPYEKPRR